MALETVGFRMLASGLADCIKHPRKSAADGYSLDQVEKLFLKLS
jgi:DNA-binding FrmR family transcriptional regulator